MIGTTTFFRQIFLTKKKLPPTFFPIFAHFYGYGALKYMYTHMCTDIYMLNCDSIKYIIF